VHDCTDGDLHQGCPRTVPVEARRFENLHTSKT
jgi:hypothetical protein